MFSRNYHLLITINYSKKFSTLRSGIASNISKKYENISLANFPLKIDSSFNLSKFNDIQNAYQKCRKEHLDYNPSYYPGVTTILNQTLSPKSLAALKKWENDKIKELGMDGYERYRTELFMRGRWLHNTLEQYLSTSDHSKIKFSTLAKQNIWKSIEHVLPSIEKLYATELNVHHPILKFRGIIDTLAEYDGRPALIEWKTSEKYRPTLQHTYDNPLQVVAYYSCLQFINYDPDNITDTRDRSKTISAMNRLPNMENVEEILLIIAYENGDEANVHRIHPLQRPKIWENFLRRLEQYWRVMASK